MIHYIYLWSFKNKSMHIKCILQMFSFLIPVNSSTSEGNFSCNHFENLIPVIQCSPRNEEAHYRANKVSVSNQAEIKQSKIIWRSILNKTHLKLRHHYPFPAKSQFTNWKFYLQNSVGLLEWFSKPCRHSDSTVSNWLDLQGQKELEII